ncbi:hypothetical protein HQ533_03500 [Candidatus Woesearchaeota archaeon]|nr:hypothetical protein [Candidatus Woesearchaeota archaeon]
MKTLTKIIATSLLALAPTIALAGDGLKGFFRTTYDKGTESVVPRTHLNYKLPGNISGLTFVDFYDGSYFGRTILNRSVSEKYGLNARATTKHTNTLHGTTGFGANIKVPNTPKGMSASVSVLPVWIDKNGIENKNILEAIVRQELPFGLKGSFVGRWEYSDSKISWSSGETDIGIKLGDYGISYHPSLCGNESAIPSLEHGISAYIHF